MNSHHFIYQGTFSFDPNFIPFDRIKYEIHKYKKGILPQIEELRKDLKLNKKISKKEKEKYTKFLFSKKENHRYWKFKYENGEIYPKDVDPPEINFIQYPEPHALITDCYDNEEEWYRLREIIKDFAEEAYLTYKKGLWFASVSCAINCCEYILKYELFRNLNKRDKDELRKATKDNYLTLGRLIKNNAYGILDLLRIKSFVKKLDYLNLIRNSIYHFNPEKEKKIKRKGKIEIERQSNISDEMVIPIIAFRVYTIMIELINKFYNKKKSLRYIEECVKDWMKKRKLTKKKIEKIFNEN